MRQMLLLSALAAGFALFGLGSGSEAQAKPHGWHKGHGHHGFYRHGPKRHHSWYRGNHYGWYKHRPRRYYERYRPYGYWD